MKLQTLIVVSAVPVFFFISTPVNAVSSLIQCPEEQANRVRYLKPEVESFEVCQPETQTNNCLNKPYGYSFYPFDHQTINRLS